MVAFEHHLNYDMSGYPHTEIKDKVTLFGSIVAIVDRYDALTSPRVYRSGISRHTKPLLYVVDGQARCSIRLW